MPSHPTPSESPPRPLTLKQPRAEIARLLTSTIEAGRQMKQYRPPYTGSNVFHDKLIDDYLMKMENWNKYNIELLRRAFSGDGILLEYEHKINSVKDAPVGTSHNRQEYYSTSERLVGKRVIQLDSILERLELYPEEAHKIVETPVDRRSRKVFVVHGHDDAALHAVARCLEQLGLDAIVLREQPDAGRTIIEKFEGCAADVGFAVVLLTPDDLGAAVTAAVTGTRARQNVVFELGYFVGKLGRGRACLMRKGTVEIPSDLQGVIYTDLDAGDGWKFKLARELNAAGIEVDANRIR
jgi:predicted nucleotide-binding protein